MKEREADKQTNKQTSKHWVELDTATAEYKGANITSFNYNYLWYMRLIPYFNPNEKAGGFLHSKAILIAIFSEIYEDWIFKTRNLVFI